jgi:hypothetical protein
MRAKLLACLPSSALVLICVALSQSQVLAAPHGTSKFEVHLIWGTNDKVSPDPKHKPVEPAVQKKLNALPLKWANYFEVNRKSLEVPAEGSTRLPLSEKCAIEVKNLTDATIEVSFIGQGKPVEKRIVTLPKGEILVYGGNAPNATAWFVILKRVE